MAFMFRVATRKDLPAIDSLSNVVLREHNLPCDSAVAERDAHYFEGGDLISVDGACFWVAENDSGEIVGSAAIVPRSVWVCLMKTLYVAKGYRGRHIGYNLLVRCERFASCHRYREIELCTSARFHNAIQLYARNGYSFVAAIDNLWQDMVYRKTITAALCLPMDTCL
jgi:N-acetylglutamate synthase-like GNAT family acetyltransferase